MTRIEEKIEKYLGEGRGMYKLYVKENDVKKAEEVLNKEKIEFRKEKSFKAGMTAFDFVFDDEYENAQKILRSKNIRFQMK